MNTDADAQTGRAWPETTEGQRRPPWWILSPGDLLRLFDGWPLLRHVAVEPRFRCAWCAGWLLAAGMVLGLPRIWIVTPHDFLPVIRISGIDWLQSVHADRLAQDAWKRGDPEVALEYWRTALSHRPATPQLLRDSLRSLLELPPRHAWRSAQAIHQSLLLLQLSHTNTADLELALRVFEHFGSDDLLLAQLSRTTRLTPAQEIAGLKALFRVGDMAGFSAVWRHVESRGDSDPELPVYQTAWRAGWGPEPGRVDADHELAAVARTDGLNRSLARRLSLLVHAHRGDLTAYAGDLASLESEHADQPVQHVAWWRLLMREGRRPEAAALALHFSIPPTNAAEVRCLAQVFLELGLSDHARPFLERYVPELGVTSDVWALYADLLLQQRDWTELRALALEIRRNAFVRYSLAGYSFYIEGLARLGNGGPDAARPLFAQVPRHPLRDSGLVVGVAANLANLGFPMEGRDLLAGHEAELGGQSAYWDQLVALAWQLRDEALLLRAARRASELAPEDASAQHQLAGALVLHQREPELAMYLTGRVLAANPTGLPVLVNRALALLLNHRVEEAAAILDTVNSDPATDLEAAMLQFAHLELQAARGNVEAVGGLSVQLETARLFPAQRERLRALRRGCGPATSATTGIDGSRSANGIATGSWPRAAKDPIESDTSGKRGGRRLDQDGNK